MWTTEREPSSGAATIASPDTEDTSVEIAAAGLYVFTLSIVDGPHTVQSSVYVQACSELRGGRDIVFVLDISESDHAEPVTSNPFLSFQKMQEMLDFCDPGLDRVGVVSMISGASEELSGFDRVTLEFALGSSYERIRQAEPSSESIDSGGNDRVNLHTGIKMAEAELTGPRGRQDVEKLVILISDGEPWSGEETKTKGAAVSAKGAGIEIAVIGLFDEEPSGAPDTILAGIASVDRYFPVDLSGTDPALELYGIFAEITQLACGNTTPFEVRVDHGGALLHSSGDIDVTLNKVDILGGVGELFNYQWELIDQLGAGSVLFSSPAQEHTSVTISGAENPSHIALRLTVRNPIHPNEGAPVQIASDTVYFTVSSHSSRDLFTVPEASIGNVLTVTDNDPATDLRIHSGLSTRSVLARVTDDDVKKSHPQNLFISADGKSVIYDAPFQRMTTSGGEHPFEDDQFFLGGVFDYFEYELADSSGNLISGTRTRASVFLAPVNEPPIAAADHSIVGIDQSKTIDVISGNSLSDDQGQDLDPDEVRPVHNKGPLLPFQMLDFDQRSQGSPSNIHNITENAGDLDYSAPEGFEGEDRFEYAITDRLGLTSRGSVAVTVTDDVGLQGYEAVDDFYVVSSSGNLELNVLANDLAPSEGIISVSEGPVSISSDNRLLIFHAPEDLPSAPIEFTYRIYPIPEFGIDRGEAKVTIGFGGSAPAPVAEISNLEPEGDDGLYKTITNPIFDLEGKAYDMNNPGSLVSYTVSVLDLGGNLLKTFQNIGVHAQEGSVLAPMDLSDLADGLYRINLRVLGSLPTSFPDDGVLDPSEEAEVEELVVLSSRRKVGQFDLSIVDLEIPVLGVPLSITRNYSTGNREMGDFGMGWTMGLVGVTLEKSTPLGSNWTGTISSTTAQYCIQPAAENRVSITIPGKETMVFKPRAVWYGGSGPCVIATSAGASSFSIEFDPITSVAGRLRAPAANMVYASDEGIIDVTADPEVFSAFDTEIFEFTDEAGRIYRFEDGKLTSLRLASGYGVMIDYDVDRGGFVFGEFDSATGAFTPSNKRVTVRRDGANGNRVSEIFAPDAHDANGAPREGMPTLKYQYLEYDAKDVQQWHSLLVQVHRRDDLPPENEEDSDPTYQTTTYHYDNYTTLADQEVVGKREDFFITRITNERGQVVRNEYDNEGRLIAVIDGEGNRTEFDHDVGGDSLVLGAVGREIIIDPLGTKTIHEYDERGNVLLSQQEGPSGEILTKTTRTYEISTHPELLSSQTVWIDPGGPSEEKLTTTYDYDHHSNNVVSELVVTQPYDRSIGEVAADYVTSYKFNESGQITEVVDANGHRSVYKYSTERGFEGLIDEIVRVVGEGEALNERTDYVYVRTTTPIEGPANSNVGTIVPSSRTSVVDSKGNETQYYQNNFGYVVAVFSFDGKVSEAEEPLQKEWFEYDANGNLVRETALRSPDGMEGYSQEFVETVYRYDAVGRLRSTTLRRWLEEDSWEELETGAPEIVYNEVGQRSQEIRRRKVVKDGQAKLESLVTTYTYDLRGNLIETGFPDGTSERSVYDAAGRLIESYDRNSRLTRFIYDGAGRLLRTDYPDGTKTVTEYDEAGRVKAFLDRADYRTQYDYDFRGRRTAITNAKLDTTQFVYDPVGNLKSVIDPGNNQVRYQYDEFNRRTHTRYLNSAGDVVGVTESRYDALGRVDLQVDENQHYRKFSYDPLGRINEVFLGLGSDDQSFTTYAYDRTGNVRTITDAEGRVTTFWHDAAGRRTKRTLPGLGNRADEYAYDEVGNLVQHTLPDESVVDYVYDLRNRLIQKESSYKVTIGAEAKEFGPTTFGYTNDGNRARLEYPQDPIDSGADPTMLSVEFVGYDGAGRLEGKITPQGTLAYSYDENGNLTQLVTDKVGSTSENGTDVEYEWDVLNRLKRVIDNNAGGTAAVYQYDNLGNLEFTELANGVTVTYDYDDRNRLKFVEYRKVDGAVVARFNYELRPDGRRRKLVERIEVDPPIVQEREYAYDALGRLISVDKDGVEEVVYDGMPGYLNDPLGFDRVGNNPQGSTNERDELVSALPENASYDANGNLVAYDGNSYYYDYENRLIRAENGKTLEYTYDGDGNRVRKVVAGEVTQFLVDDLNPTGYAQVVEERDGAGGLTRRYVYGLDLISHQDPGGTAVYYGYDGLGNGRFLMDSNGNITETFDYEPFGTLIGAIPTEGNHYLFTGEQYDADLGLYYLRARYYDASTRRFLSRDPFEGTLQDPMTMHPYMYAHNDPINNVDPSGNLTIGQVSAAGAIVGSLSGAGFGAADAALEKGATLRDVGEAAAFGFVFGGAFGAALPFLSPAVTTGVAVVGTGAGGFAAGQSLAQGNIAQAGLRLAGLAGGLYAGRLAISKALTARNTPKPPRRVFTSSDRHVGEAATRLDAEFPGSVLGVNRQTPMRTGNPREIDIELDQIIVQVKEGRARGLLGQIQSTQADTPGKLVIGYAPDSLPDAAWQNAAKVGVPIARNIDELIAIVRLMSY